MRAYVSDAQKLGCPSAPENAIFVFDEEDRPQPRLDRDFQNGYTVSVGRVREDESGIFDIKFVALSHNSEFSLCLLGGGITDDIDSCHRSRGVVYSKAEAAVLKGLA